MLDIHLSNAPACIVHARNDYMEVREEEGQIPTQRFKFISDPNVDACRFKSLEGSDEQGHHQMQ